MQPDARHAERGHAFGEVDAEFFARFIHRDRCRRWQTRRPGT
jgi:hypothetical protein